MANVDLTRFPELRPLMQQRDRQASLIRMRQQLDPMGGDHILMFWQELVARIQEEDESWQAAEAPVPGSGRARTG